MRVEVRIEVMVEVRNVMRVEVLRGILPLVYLVVWVLMAVSWMKERGDVAWSTVWVWVNEPVCICNISSAGLYQYLATPLPCEIPRKSSKCLCMIGLLWMRLRVKGVMVMALVGCRVLAAVD